MADDAPGTSGRGMETDEEDEVLMEYPVYVCHSLHGSATQVVLFQHPLRPPWRPYDYHNVKTLRMKPNARRVEVDLPLDAESSNYNDIIEDFKKVKQVTLRSQVVDSKASLALGALHEGKLLLVPLDYSVQLRPALTHLNVGNIKKGKDEEEEDSDDEPVMRQVEVQVQKRETERQQQARLNSYAHLSAKEEEEAWKQLRVHTSDTVPAERVWNRLVPSSSSPLNIEADMSRTAFLRAFVPTLGGQPNALVSSEAVGVGAGTSAGPSGGEAGDAAARQPVEQVPPEKLKALEASMKLLFAKHGVCTMANIRQWLQDPASNSGVAKDMGTMTDRALHDALLETGLLVHIRRVYMLKVTGVAATDPFRAVVIDMLKEKETFKRSEVIEAAQQRNINVTDTMYNRVVKDICQSKGYHWMLKNGADM